MSTRTSQDDHQDHDIIELTEVVEEPDESSAAEPSALRQQNDDSSTPHGQTTDLNWSQSQRQPAESDEDDFDFSSLMHDSGSSDTSSHSQTQSSLQKSWSKQTSFEDQDYDDLEDLFEELDLDLDPDQDGYLGARNDQGGKTKTEKQMQALHQRLEDLASRSVDQASLQSLESRIGHLEQGTGSGNRESWKEVENRILNRLEEMVEERITKARQTLHQEIETVCQDKLAARKEEVRELAQKVEDINNYALGPETLSALKNELWTELSQRIEETVPLAAAQIIRQEIQALREEEQDWETKVSEE